MALNLTALQGNIVFDIEYKEVGDKKTPLSTLTVACSNGTGDYENTVFMSCKAWGKTATFINNYFKKGSKIIVSGKLEQDNWLDKDSGAKRSKLVLNVRDADFAGDKKGAGGGASVPSTTVATAPMGHDDIPF